MNSDGVVCEAGLVVLSATIWREELERELVRLGVPGAKASVSAGRVLHRICGHAGWPRSSYLVHGTSGETVSQDPDDRVDGGRPAGHASLVGVLPPPPQTPTAAAVTTAPVAQEN